MTEYSRNLFITGATGFVGMHLIRALAGSDYSLFMLALPGEKLPEYSGLDIEWITGNLNEPESYQAAISKCSTVIHMAAELYNPERFELVNVKGVQNLINAIKQSNVSKVIHLSSVGVVGMQFSVEPVLVKETSPCFPKNGYEISKLKSEQLLKEQIPESQLIILRPTNVYGDLHPRNHLLGLFQYIKGHKSMYISDKAFVNYIYAGDLAHTIRFFVENNNQCGTFNVGGSMNMREFIKTMSEVSGAEIRVRALPEWMFSMVIVFKRLLPASIVLKILSLRNAVRYADEKLMNILKAEFSYKDGLKKTFDYYISKKLIND